MQVNFDIGVLILGRSIQGTQIKKEESTNKEES